MPAVTVHPASDSEYMLAVGDQSIPIEQSPVWDAFDRAVRDRRPWERLLIREADQVVGAISMSAYRGRGFRYLWARNGPVWFVEPTPQREQALRDALGAHIRGRDRGMAFMRLHARHRSTDTFELLQTMTYDRTVIVDLEPSEDEILAQMRQRGRRCIRKGMRDETLQFTEETGLCREDFDRLYDVLIETAQRDGFGIAPSDLYWQMLQALGPQHCRMFVVRRDGRPLAWAIVTVYRDAAVYYYGASSAEGRRAWAADLLHWRIMQQLRTEGVRSYDLMGIDSDRAPALKGVAEFKLKFVSEPTEVDGAWDVPLRPRFYQGLRMALAAKRRGTVAAQQLRERIRSLRERKSTEVAP